MSRRDWYFPRSQFVEQVYKYLAFGPIQGVSIFGPRRTGKTQFLTRDLAPLVEEKGHRVVYANLWQQDREPLATLLQALDLAVRGGSLVDRLKATAYGIASKIRIKVPGTSTELELDAADLKENDPTDLLFLMDEYCGYIADDERPAFLLLDEFQELEKAAFSNKLIAALRVCLDKRWDSLVAVFTGSSQDSLRHVFTDRSAPFFAFAEEMDLPPLEEDFVDHQLEVFSPVAQTSIERSSALEVFYRFNRNPLILQKWLMKLTVHPDMDKETAVAQVLEDMAKILGFKQSWEELSSTKRYTACLISEGIAINGEEGGKKGNGAAGKGEHSADELKAAVERLYALGIAERSNGDWIIGDELFRDWIKERRAAEF